MPMFPALLTCLGSLEQGDKQAQAVKPMSSLEHRSGAVTEDWT